jgi:hypothetical protein
MLATAAMVVVVLLARTVSGGLEHQLLARLVLEVSVGALTYVGTIWWMGGPLRDEILEVAGWIVRAPGFTSGAK